MKTEESQTQNNLRFPTSLESYQFPNKYYFGLWIISLSPLLLHLAHIDLGLLPRDPDRFYVLSSLFSQNLNFFVYTILEWSIFCSVSFIFLLTFFYYRITQKIVVFFVSIVFLCIALVDASSTIIHLKSFQEGKYLTETWILRSFFGMLLLFYGICIFQFSKKPLQKKNFFIFLCFFITLTTVSVLYILHYKPSTFPSFSSFFLHRIIPLTNVLCLFFMLVGLKFIFPHFFQKAPSFFSYLLALSIIPHFFCQIYFSYGSREPFDHYFYSALFLQLFANLLLFFGLLLDTQQIYQFAHSTQGELRQEISKREKIEDSFHESVSRWLTFVNSSGDGIVLIDTEGIIVFFNRSAEKIFGYKAEEVMGKNVKILMPSPYDEEHDHYLQNYLKTGIKKIIGTHREVEGKCKDGEIIIIELTVSEIVQDKKRLFAGIVRDVTSRKILEQALVEAKEDAETLNLAKSQFLANMSHELRTPLNSVIGFSNILLKNKAQNLTTQDLTYLDKIQKNGNHLLNLINNILDLSKIESGQTELTLEFVDLRILIEETLQNLEAQFLEKEPHVKLLAKFPKEIQSIKTDRSKLKQVLINIIANSLKFTEKGHIKIEIETDNENNPTKISVSDTGLGVPKDKLEKIFEAFQQADNTISRKYGGTGLGLAICRAILNLLNFTLQVTSVEGKGSIFTILLKKTLRTYITPQKPLVDTTEEKITKAFQISQKRPPSSSLLIPFPDEKEKKSPSSSSILIPFPDEKEKDLLEHPQSNKRINGTNTIVYKLSDILSPEAQSKQDLNLLDKKVLIIDDDKDSVEYLLQTLQQTGAEVFYSDSGEEGISLTRKHLPHLIFLDLLLPDKNGWEIIDLLGADPELKNIPVIIYSVIADENKRSLPHASGFIEKPFSEKELQQVIRKCFLQKEQTRVLIIEKDKDFRQILLSFINRREFDNRVVSNMEEAKPLLTQFAPHIIISQRKAVIVSTEIITEKISKVEKSLNTILENLEDMSDIFPKEKNQRPNNEKDRSH